MNTLQLFMVKEAVHSVAMEHAPDCDCLTCRAADGDQEAMEEIMADMAQA